MHFSGGDSADDKVEPIYVRAAGLELLGHMSAIIAADWMPGGNQVITASWDRTANIFDAEKGEIINTLTGEFIKNWISYCLFAGLQWC